MTSGPDPAPGRDDLTARVFRALYSEFDLRPVHDATYVAVPKGTPVFIGDSLGQIARQISDGGCKACEMTP